MGPRVGRIRRPGHYISSASAVSRALWLRTSRAASARDRKVHGAGRFARRRGEGLACSEPRGPSAAAIRRVRLPRWHVGRPEARGGVPCTCPAGSGGAGTGPAVLTLVRSREPKVVRVPVARRTTRSVPAQGRTTAVQAVGARSIRTLFRQPLGDTPDEARQACHPHHHRCRRSNRRRPPERAGRPGRGGEARPWRRRRSHRTQGSPTRGTGVFANISCIQRLNTRGGVAPAAACTGADQVSVPYSATYAIYKPAK